MTRIVAAYFTTLILFAVIDFIWISSMANVLYRPVLKDILLPSFKPAPAAAFYLLYTAGIVIFAVTPALRSGNWFDAALYGALLGLIAYGTYNLTNQATLKNWETNVTLIDMSWGTASTAMVATIGYFAAGFAERMLR